MNDKWGHDSLYNNIMFRSTLEARWAIFFDVLGIAYVYEPRRLYFPDGEDYLPDFWLPQVQMWAEVKPILPDERERRLAFKPARDSRSPRLFLVGHPNFCDYWAILPDGSECNYILVMHKWENRFIDQPWDGFRFPFDYEEAVEAARTAQIEWVD